MSDSDDMSNELQARRQRLNGGIKKSDAEIEQYEKNAYMDDDDEVKGLSGSYSTASEKHRDEKST